MEGVEVETDLGAWRVYETPGHAPSHVVLHQPERGLLLSGDHLLGRVSLYYDYGYTPDPAGEFLHSLDKAEKLEARKDDPDATADLGVAYATLQCADLLARGAPGIHFYTLNRSPATRAILAALRAAQPWTRAAAVV